ncbi:unnamed protein product [Durusdinium trenchii]|uniref:Uncharacterized protein n=1 Tax=Durusdinium trenchii TaxID=1381693 RepID=A0ABP0LDZ0_9DINO
MTDADSRLFIDEVSLERFDHWRERVQEDRVVHIKGFGDSPKSEEACAVYDEDALKILHEHCSLLVWDGDDYNPRSFTRLVPKFLALGEDRRAAAFRKSSEPSILGFKKSWSKVAEQFPGRVALVPMDIPSDPLRLLGQVEIRDLPPERAQFVLLGRAAIKVTRAQRVLALGGGLVALKEAELSELDALDASRKAAEGQKDVAYTKWTVFALSRGRQEKFRTLLDWAKTNPVACDHFERGKDPDEALGYGCAEMPETVSPERKSKGSERT